MLKKVCAIAVFLVSLTVPGRAVATWNHPLPYDVYRALSDCETGSNTAHLTRTYVGAFGFTKQVWDWFADTAVKDADRLTYVQHVRVMDRAFFYGWHGRFAVGPWGHGCWKRLWQTNHHLRQAVCNNGKWKVRRWCR